MKRFNNYLLLAILPLLFVGWGIFAIVAFDPFYSRSIDPEFPYLLNGLTVALFETNDIGHFDHPGTPFQVFIGVGIRIIHLFTGQGSLTQDVLSRHQHYMAGISLMLTLMTSVLLFVIGWVGKKRDISTWNLIVLQAGFLFSDLLLWQYARLVPERWMMLTSLLFIWIYLAYGYENRHMIKFAIWSGMVMGMGLATKFNFLPLLMLPLFMININKLRYAYAGITVASFILCISPVLNRFQEYKKFITSLAKHDGLYGSGEANMFNIEKIMDGLREIFRYTPELILWIAIIVFVLAISLYARKTRDTRTTASLFLAFLLVIGLQTLMVAKHFKAAYQVPVHSILGFMLFSFSLFLTSHYKSKWIRYAPVAAICILVAGMNLARMIRDSDHIFQHQQQRTVIADFVSTHMPRQATWFVEPTWLSGPHQENAIIFGLSYARNRDKYLPELRKINPNVITYEGNPDAVKVWRGAPASLDSLVATGAAIHIYDTPGRYAYLLMDMLQQSAARQGLLLQADTLFSQAETNSHILAFHARKDTF